MIVLEDVTVTLGKRKIVKDFSFHVPSGSCVALWGANGAGKSTTLHAILGLVPFTGMIRVAGYDVKHGSVAAHRQIGWVPQEFAPLDMTVRQTVRFIAELRKTPPRPLAEVLEPVGLQHADDTPVTCLSGGQRQRLSLALATLGDPAVLLLDEPTASLDVAGRDQILNLLTVFRKQGKTLILASHRGEDVRRLADRVVTMEDGSIREIAAPFPVNGVWRSGKQSERSLEHAAIHGGHPG